MMSWLRSINLIKHNFPYKFKKVILDMRVLLTLIQALQNQLILGQMKSILMQHFHHKLLILSMSFIFKAGQ